MNNVGLEHYLIVGAVLFALGLMGFLARRNLIVMFLCAEMMLQGVAINLVAFARFHGNLQGQSFTLFVITVAACEAGIALALILMFQKKFTLPAVMITGIIFVSLSEIIEYVLVLQIASLPHPPSVWAVAQAASTGSRRRVSSAPGCRTSEGSPRAGWWRLRRGRWLRPVPLPGDPACAESRMAWRSWSAGFC